MNWRGFGFVYHSRTLFYRAVPNLSEFHDSQLFHRRTPCRTRDDAGICHVPNSTGSMCLGSTAASASSSSGLPPNPNQSQRSQPAPRGTQHHQPQHQHAVERSWSSPAIIIIIPPRVLKRLGLGFGLEVLHRRHMSVKMVCGDTAASARPPFTDPRGGVDPSRARGVKRTWEGPAPQRA
jgi:hypothetical protein